MPWACWFLSTCRDALWHVSERGTQGWAQSRVTTQVEGGNDVDVVVTVERYALFGVHERLANGAASRREQGFHERAIQLALVGGECQAGGGNRGNRAAALGPQQRLG